MSPADKLLLERIALGNAYVTAAEGSMLAQHGLIEVDSSQTDGKDPPAYLCRLSPQGKQMLDQSVATAPESVTEEDFDFEIESGVEVPAVKRGNAGHLTPRKAKYPFALLEVGQSFHVAVTEDNPTPWKTLQSSTAAANTRFREPVEPEELEEVTHRRRLKDDDGEWITDGDGNFQYESFTQMEAKTVQTKKFVARQVGADDPKGPGCRVFRVELDD